MAADLRTVLLTGATGYLGQYLATSLRRSGVRLVTTARSGADLDVDFGREGEIEDALARWQPEVIVHAAAMSSMSACDRDPARAHVINAEAVAVLAASTARLVHISTDLVFDGTEAPYDTVAPPRPLSVYGETKAASEGAALGGDALVVRLPLLFGRSHDGRRGATDMIRGADDVVALFRNEYRTPLHVADAAGGIAALALDGERKGIVHLAGADRVSRYELGRRFAAIAGLPADLITAIDNTDSQRPADVSLTADSAFRARPLDQALADA